MAKNWDEYWQKEETFFGKTLSFVRKKIIADELSKTLEKYFPKTGLCIDAGSRSSETSLKIKNRKIIALDLSYLVLKKVDKNLPINSKINADIFKLPFKDDSVDGIFNLGVMEHFKKEDIIIILNEFYRVLKKDSYCILFWPSTYGPVNVTFSAIGFVLRKQFFPDEISLYKSKAQIKTILKETRFNLVKIRWPLKGALIYHEIILKK